MGPDLNHDLRTLVETLAVEPDAGRRGRLLVQAAEEASGAAGACLWRAAGDGWRPLVGLGDARALPTGHQVQAVADGDLEPELPPARLVARVGPWALALGGLPPAVDREELLDGLEALLVTACALFEEPLDLPLPPLPSPSSRRWDAA